MKTATIVKILVTAITLICGGFVAALATGIPFRPSKYTEIHDNRTW